MHRFAALVEAHADELALLECRNVGMPIGDARGQLGMIVDVLRYYAGAVDKFFGHTIPVEREGVALTFREPIGVVGLITPWNFPLNIANWKIAPALAAGNTVVLKPASLTPLSVLRYAELARRGRHPGGGAERRPRPRRRRSGTRSSSIPASARSGSPGSTEVGAGIARRAAATVKRVTLELGGKSACVVFADADLEKVGRHGAVRGVRELRPGLLRPLAPDRAGVGRRRGGRALRRDGAQPARRDAGERRHRDRAADLERPARDGRALRRAGPGRGRAARDRRRAPRRRPRGRVLLPPDGARRRAQRHDRRARGDLRPGRLGDHVPRRGRRRADRKRHAVRPVRARCGRATAPASCASPARCAPACSA